MSRLGLIGINTNSKSRSGVYSPSDNVSYLDSIQNIQSYTFDGVSNALANSTTPNGLCFSKDGTKLYTTSNTGARATASIQQYNLSTPFDLRTISYSGNSLIVGDYDINPTDVTISDDGTKLFFNGFSSDAIWSCTLSSPYNLGTATTDVKRAYVGTQDATPSNIYITSNPAAGISTQYVYVMGTTSDTVYQYSISNWDISTAALVGSRLVNVGISSINEATPRSVTFSSDGTQMFILGETSDAVIAYDLPQPWRVSTSRTRVQSLNVTTQDATPVGLYFKPDGRSLYVVGTTGDDVNQYNLGTAWDLTTATFVGVSTIPSSTQTAVSDATPYDVFFKDDGTRFYVMGGTNDTVRQYSVGIAWSITSPVAFQTSFSVTAQEATPFSLYFSPDGSKMFVIGDTGDDVNQYSLSTPWDLSSGVGFTTNTAALGEATPRGLWFGDDGYKMYVCGTTGDAIRQFNLTVPYDATPSNVAFSTSLYVGMLDATPSGVGFSTDGTKVFIVGATNDIIYRLELSTPWQLNTCRSYAYVGNEELTPYSVSFSTDGTNMYVTGATGDDLNQYTLSTAWDISTVTYTRTAIYPGAVETDPYALYFKPDGTRVYVLGQGLDAIKQIDLSTPWNVSTMSSVGVQTFYTPALNPSGIFFKDDGTDLYVSDITTDTIKQYTLTTPWDISTATGGLMIFGSVAANQLENTSRGLSISPDGNYLFFTGNTQSNIRRITLPSPNTLVGGGTSIYNTVQSYSGTSTLGPSGMYISSDGKIIYITSVLGTTRRAHQIKLSSAYDLSTASVSSNYIALYGNPTQNANLFGIALSDDLDKMSIVSDVTPFISQYSVQFL